MLNNSSNNALQPGGANNNNESLGNEPIRNPLKIDLIIKNTFSFLNLKDMKNCRLVCKKWDNVAEPLVRQRSKIVFRRPYKKNRKNTDPVGFNETFQDSGTAVPFNSFRFRSLKGVKGAWTIIEITNFLEQHGRDVEELEFHNFVLKRNLKYGFQIANYDVSPWISGLRITKLVIDCFQFSNSPNLIVNLSQLQSVKKLRLKNVRVNCELGTRISLSELELEKVKFCDREGRELDSCRLNDYVDFKDTKEVHCSADKSAIILDFKDFTNVKEFNLRKCTIVNWGISQCSVEIMKLVDIPLSATTPMRIKELHFNNSYIDLVALPPEIEKLVYWNNTEISCSEPINLPNLSSLYIETTRFNNLQPLSHFQNSPRLVDIHIHNPFMKETALLNLDWIPTSIKRLKLAGNIAVEHGPLQLDTLIVEKGPFYKFMGYMTVTSKIRPQNLLITCHKGFDLDWKDTVDFFRGQFNFCVGPFRWKQDSFAKSQLAKYVDREADYYFFQDQLGKAIDVNEFNSRNFNL